jgi:hypothetical protein
MIGRLSASVCITIAGVLTVATHAFGGMRLLDYMMVELAPESAETAQTIRRVYQDHLDVLALHEYTELANALDNGGLVPLPDNPLRFNIRPRVEGDHPIGEMDLGNQSSYTAARAATIGALLEIASRVKSGPVEVTSLVRHGDYQEVLRTTNPNAITSVPMHTMGLAVDIGLINTPMKTVYEIRDVLQRMQDAGDILFIGERKQLVFHVVPHPSRLGHFNDVYLRAVGSPPTSRFAEAVAFSGEPGPLPAILSPSVTTEIVAMVPTTGPVQNVWVEEPPATTAARTSVNRGAWPRLLSVLTALRGYWHELSAGRWLGVLAAFAAAWLLISRPARVEGLRLKA